MNKYKKKIILIATGGTIASTGKANGGDLFATMKGEDLISQLPDFENLGIELEVINFSMVNSTNITPKMMIDLCQEVQILLDKPDIDGIVVTHGTSLMEETAFVLDSLIDSDKPVVITGSQINASSPWSDGRSNLNDALIVATSTISRGMGVLVVFCGKIHEGRLIIKNDTMGLDAFISVESSVLGNVHYGQVIYNRARVRKVIQISSFEYHPVEIVPFYSGADARALKDAAERGARGIVVEGVGLGNVSNDFAKAIKDICADGLKVIITSRSRFGRLMPIYGYEGGGGSLREKGVLFSSLPSPKARLLLMLILGSEQTFEDIRELLD